MGVVVIVGVVIAEGCHEVSKSSLTCTMQKISPFRVVGPPIFSHGPSWLALMTESSVVRGVVNVVMAAVVTEVHVQIKVIGVPYELKWSTKVK